MTLPLVISYIFQLLGMLSYFFIGNWTSWMLPCWISGFLLTFVFYFLDWGGFFHFLFFCLFRVLPVAYGSSQARGPIWAIAASLYHSQSNADLSHICKLYRSSQQCWILNPPNEAKYWTCILMDDSRVHSPWATMGTPPFVCIGWRCRAFWEGSPL